MFSSFYCLFCIINQASHKSLIVTVSSIIFYSAFKDWRDLEKKPSHQKYLKQFLEILDCVQVVTYALYTVLCIC